MSGTNPEAKPTHHNKSQQAIDEVMNYLLADITFFEEFVKNNQETLRQGNNPPKDGFSKHQFDHKQHNWLKDLIHLRDQRVINHRHFPNILEKVKSILACRFAIQKIKDFIHYCKMGFQTCYGPLVAYLGQANTTVLSDDEKLSPSNHLVSTSTNSNTTSGRSSISSSLSNASSMSSSLSPTSTARPALDPCAQPFQPQTTTSSQKPSPSSRASTFATDSPLNTSSVPQTKTKTPLNVSAPAFRPTSQTTLAQPPGSNSMQTPYPRK